MIKSAVMHIPYLDCFMTKGPRVSVVRLHGAIGMAGRGGSLSDAALAPVIERAFRKGKPVAVALSINSPGGSPVQSSLIAARIRRLARRLRQQGHPERPSARQPVHAARQSGRMIVVEGYMDVIALAAAGFAEAVAPLGTALTEPIPLVDGVEVDQGGWKHGLVRRDDGWALRSLGPEGWSDRYVYTVERQHLIDYVAASHFTSTHPSSHFTRSPFAVRIASTMPPVDSVRLKSFGVNTAATPISRRDLASRVGMIPPTITGTS